MSAINSAAIMLRRISYGDYDLIVTLLTRDRGKLSFMAKAAKKSAKRFPGILEPFALLNIVYHCRPGRKGLVLLKEANLIRPFSNIRNDYLKTAYASYWTELAYLWLEEGRAQIDLFNLLGASLSDLDRQRAPTADISVVFQMRFAVLAGLAPALGSCTRCQAQLHHSDTRTVRIDLDKGGIVCPQCPPPAGSRGLTLGRGTLKQLLWVASGSLDKARRMRFSPVTRNEANAFLEAFIPYHVGKMPKSLKLLKQFRDTASN